MAQAPSNWPDAIATVSEAFMNAIIELRDPTLVTTTRDVETNAVVTTGDPVIATNLEARIQPIRGSMDVSGGQVSNPSGEVRIRVQIPRTAYAGKILRGWQIRVISAERNPTLVDYLFVVDANVNSSWRASNTIEATVNVENDPNWSA